MALYINTQLSGFADTRYQPAALEQLVNTVSQTVTPAQGVGLERFGCLEGKHNCDVRLAAKLCQSAIGTLRRYIKGMDLVQFLVVASCAGIGQQKQGNRAGGKDFAQQSVSLA
ncbi:hypothetical protein [Pseudoteredinibacter isoporae]|uniref:Uncharacterized protein n=1 Tax=Pseudoteredinibacter isoporae TaxID=570281 RepID=A0A7X0JWW6_9GAMM|nr:hypothetical protein [Pseudoteredinibacter isoporae]MBB6523745.1 hypothetical protein [Pseudoteredinibacter isoporae]